MAQDDKKYDESFGLLADEIGVPDTKVMGVFGAMGHDSETTTQIYLASLDTQKREAAP